MNKKLYVVAILATLAVVLAGGAVVASNMGFKLNYQLLAAGASSNSGLNTIALPYNRQSGVDTARNLMDDIGFANVAEVSRFVEGTDSLETHTGRKGSPAPDFPLAAGEYYVVKMNADVDYIVVGSHDPSLAVSLDAAGAGSNSGLNYFAYPYHSTAATARDLMDDIGFASVAEVSRFIRSTDSLETHTGRKGSPAPDFPLAPGEGYVIKMNSTVSYVPSHY